LFCIIGQKAEGEEVKSKKGKVKRGEGKGKRLRAEDGPGAGRGARWIGGLDGWDWQFWGFGRFMVILRPPGFDLFFVSYYLLFGIKYPL